MGLQATSSPEGSATYNRGNGNGDGKVTLKMEEIGKEEKEEAARKQREKETNEEAEIRRNFWKKVQQSNKPINHSLSQSVFHFHETQSNCPAPILPTTSPNQNCGQTSGNSLQLPAFPSASGLNNTPRINLRQSFRQENAGFNLNQFQKESNQSSEANLSQSGDRHSNSSRQPSDRVSQNSFSEK